MPIAFEQVTYTYPCSQHPAVQDLTIAIPPGHRCALIGRNGCGKSTLLRLADGLFHPDRGQVSWQGQPLNYRAQALRSLRQQIGLVFQDPEQQLVATTVEEDLSYGLCNLGLPDAEVASRVQLALQEFDLLELADTPINHLSLGQKKRVAIADVMILRPQLLLMDEPTAYLDPAQTRTLFQSLERIHSAGTTILIATHDLEFVYTWADWLMVMDRGSIVLEGTPQEVFAHRTLLHELGLGLPLVIDILTELPISKTDLKQIHQILRNRFSH